MFLLEICRQCYYAYLCRLLSRRQLQKKSSVHRRDFGAMGERLARAYLRLQGLRILAANWRHDRSGEIDIIAKKGRVVVFCEVKTRSSCAFARPITAVNAAKRRLIRKAAKHWLGQNRWCGACFRFDVIEICVLPGCRPQLRWHKNAFSLRGK